MDIVCIIDRAGSLMRKLATITRPRPHADTYSARSYCHNSHIRQFREAASTPALPASKPVEDVTVS